MANFQRPFELKSVTRHELAIVRALARAETIQDLRREIPRATATEGTSIAELDRLARQLAENPLLQKQAG
ncbi:MAG TPA: hypothetical protein VMV59_02720 [Candidatus Dormibacteraeota bacterium]|nr:hypothetical protein [Candidatus Dormibacteraeota bacterium]